MSTTLRNAALNFARDYWLAECRAYRHARRTFPFDVQPSFSVYWKARWALVTIRNLREAA